MGESRLRFAKEVACGPAFRRPGEISPLIIDRPNGDTRPSANTSSTPMYKYGIDCDFLGYLDLVGIISAVDGAPEVWNLNRYTRVDRRITFPLSTQIP